MFYLTLEKHAAGRVCDAVFFAQFDHHFFDSAPEIVWHVGYVIEVEEMDILRIAISADRP